ncbi:L,D-transpeptidase catalytic domain [Marinobacter persicus]|uniref:L,D-transpeptidase catalytic domain n=1 Tax=Marinobacter persicus TaxID=930118 RepID=A0A1I3V9N6_9GAMM|nr:L,D-transpeptidase family protein [Marinobacter persicus]SFJ91719.1 L,D-transpeptidase catalytic domain [Marinobacter persicus]
MAFRSFLLLPLLLVASLASGNELLAKIDPRMSVLPQRADTDTLPEVAQVLVRKAERRLYLLDDNQRAVRSYRVSLGDDPEGHKLSEGDERTPEGDYVLDWRLPDSDFYKSIHISYPNERDRELADAWGLDPGGSIMIHGLPNNAGDMAFAYVGLDWTDGCIAVSNEAMDEIWALVDNGTPIRIEP